MASTKYTKSISSDFPNQKVNAGRLATEIQASAIVTALDYISTSGDDCDIWFKAELSEGDQTTLTSVCAAHSGEPLADPTTDDGVPIVTIPARQSDGAILVSEGANLAGSEFIRASHNFADRTTWYGDSVRVSDETLVDSGDGLTWNSEHAVWIDLVHGKILAEEDLTGYSVVVKVDGVTQTMRDPFADDFEDGGDYYVDYRSGDVIFEVSQAGHTVTASYSYENGSGWYLSPSTGKLLFLKEAEINISSDVELNDTIQYLIQAYVPGYGWVTVGSAEYRAGWQIIQECRGNHPVIPAFGGTARGTQHDVYQIPFVYVADRELKSSQGIRLNARLKAHKEFGGEHASITFYCLSRPEI